MRKEPLFPRLCDVRTDNKEQTSHLIVFVLFMSACLLTSCFQLFRSLFIWKLFNPSGKQVHPVGCRNALGTVCHEDGTFWKRRHWGGSASGQYEGSRCFRAVFWMSLGSFGRRACNNACGVLATEVTWLLASRISQMNAGCHFLALLAHSPRRQWEALAAREK